MHVKKVLVISLGILAVCLLFAVCMGVGTALSGLDRVAQQGQPAQQAPGELFVPLLIFSFTVGIVVSYLILRSSWHGWTLAAAMFVGMYGISTVVSQLESIFLLSSKLPAGMIRALFVQGAIGTALFAPLAVLVLGKWRAAVPGVASPEPAGMSAASAAWRLVLLIIAFVFLYLFFGYYVAWQNPELRRYYGGPEWPNFIASLRGNWQNSPWIFLLASFRALLHVAFVYPLIRMLRAGQWESALAAALFLSCWTTVLLLPNPLMPASVARSHFWETLGFNLVFGSLLGWLLSTPPSTVEKSVPAAPHTD
jgi:hypothetical protein